MNGLRISILLATLGLSACASFPGMAPPPIARVEIPNSAVAIASAVSVPPGYTTYYISGMLASPVDPSAPAGTKARMGDTEAQTASVLSKLKATLAQLGLTFGDVVAAHVFLGGDPDMQGKMDFAGMNRAWSKEFGTPSQPNKPARAAVQVQALVLPGALVEIEMIAARKAP